MNLRVATVVVVFCGLVLAGVIVAGPVNPPAGPVGDTRTVQFEADARIPLTQETTPSAGAFVYVINRPGSYYLDDVLNVETGMSGVRIASENVTLDLNGFSIIGEEGSLDGVLIDGTGLGTGVVVRNGTISGVGQSGIDGFFTRRVVVSDMVVRECGGAGIVLGLDANVARCVVEENQGDGINVGGPSVVRDCHAVGNSRGIVGSGLIDGSLATQNRGDGFVVGAGVIQDCAASVNIGAGFRLASDASQFTVLVRADRCVARRNAVGFAIGSALVDEPAEIAELRDCTAAENTESGFELQTISASFIDCMARSNGAAGFALGGDSTVSGCTAVENTVGYSNVVSLVDMRGSSAINNKAQGIVVIGSGSVVRGCTSRSNGDADFTFRSGAMLYGPVVGGTGVISTTAGESTNYGDSLELFGN